MRIENTIKLSVCSFSSSGILAGDWSVQLPVSPICAVVGSAVVLPCSFDFPQSSNKSEKMGGLLAQVKKKKKKGCNINDSE